MQLDGSLPCVECEEDCLGGRPVNAMICDLLFVDLIPMELQNRPPPTMVIPLMPPSNGMGMTGGSDGATLRDLVGRRPDGAFGCAYTGRQVAHPRDGRQQVQLLLVGTHLGSDVMIQRRSQKLRFLLHAAFPSLATEEPTGRTRFSPASPRGILGGISATSGQFPAPEPPRGKPPKPKVSGALWWWLDADSNRRPRDYETMGLYF